MYNSPFCSATEIGHKVVQIRRKIETEIGKKIYLKNRRGFETAENAFLRNIERQQRIEESMQIKDLKPINMKTRFWCSSRLKQYNCINKT